MCPPSYRWSEFFLHSGDDDDENVDDDDEEDEDDDNDSIKELWGEEKRLKQEICVEIQYAPYFGKWLCDCMGKFKDPTRSSTLFFLFGKFLFLLLLLSGSSNEINSDYPFQFYDFQMPLIRIVLPSSDGSSVVPEMLLIRVRFARSSFCFIIISRAYN